MVEPTAGGPLGVHRNAIPLLAKAPQTIPFLRRRPLCQRSVEALMDLRKRVDEMLLGRRAELQQQLERIAVVGGRRIVRGGGSALKGRKVSPKYRSPSGETWAGRDFHIELR